MVLIVVLYRPGVAKGRGKEDKGKGPLGKHPISGAPKLDAALNRTDEASDASSGDSIGANSSQEAADDSSHAGPSAAANQGAPCAFLMPVLGHISHFRRNSTVIWLITGYDGVVMIYSLGPLHGIPQAVCHKDIIMSSHNWSQKQACR